MRRCARADRAGSGTSGVDQHASSNGGTSRRAPGSRVRATGRLRTAAIYADALSEAGNPLGEFITLSLLASRDKKQEVRRLALAKSQLPALLGPLAKVVFKRDLEFEAGLLSRCTVDAQSPQLVEAAVGNPWWSTVVDLHGPARVFLHPALRRLRLQDDEDLSQLLAASPLKIDTLACVVRPPVVPQLDRACLPTVRHLRAYSCNADPRSLLDAPSRSSSRPCGSICRGCGVAGQPRCSRIRAPSMR